MNFDVEQGFVHERGEREAENGAGGRAVSLNLTGQIYLRRAAEGADCEAEAEVAALRAQGQEGGRRARGNPRLQSSAARRTGCSVASFGNWGSENERTALL